MTNQNVVVVGDIHGDLERLEAVLASKAYQNAAYRVFVLDVIDGAGTNNLACLERVMGLTDAVWVRANHEERLFPLVEAMLAAADANNTSLLENIAIRDNQLTTAAELIELFITEQQQRQDGTLKHNEDGDFSRFARRFLAWYKRVPYFVRIGKVYVAHGGWSSQMLDAENPRVRTMLQPGVFTAKLYESEAKKALYGWDLYKSLKKQRDDAPPAGVKLVVGHHRKRCKETGMPLDMGSALFIDTGCGKGGHLSVVELTVQGEHLTTYHL